MRCRPARAAASPNAVAPVGVLVLEVRVLEGVHQVVRGLAAGHRRLQGGGVLDVAAHRRARPPVPGRVPGHGDHVVARRSKAAHNRRPTKPDAPATSTFTGPPSLPYRGRPPWPGRTIPVTGTYVAYPRAWIHTPRLPSRRRIPGRARNSLHDFRRTGAADPVARRLARAIQGKGAFRRFQDELHEEYPDLLPAWYAFREIRAKRRAVQWLADNSLIDDDAASRFLSGHPDPDLP